MNTGIFLACMAAFGAVHSPAGSSLAWPAAVLTGLAFAAPVDGVGGRRRTATPGSRCLFRFVMIPLFLFSGTFFPLVAAARLAPAARVRHAAVARRRAVPRAGLGTATAGSVLLPLAYLLALSAPRSGTAPGTYRRRLYP